MLLDVYGNAKEYTGEKCFVPFRYQGHYEDKETHQYYNRFRASHVCVGKCYTLGGNSVYRWSAAGVGTVCAYYPLGQMVRCV